MSPNLWVSLQVAHMSIKMAADMRCDNTLGFAAPQEIKYALGQRFGHQHGDTHAQLLGNMQSKICELEAANGQTQTKKKQDRAPTDTIEHGKNSTGVRCRSIDGRHQVAGSKTSVFRKFSNTHDTAKEFFKHTRYREGKFQTCTYVLRKFAKYP